MDVAIYVACGASAVSGFCLAVETMRSLARARRARRAKSSMGGGEAVRAREGESPVLTILRRRARASPSPRQRGLASWPFWGLGMRDARQLIARAGLPPTVTPESARDVRMRFAGAGLAAGVAAGALFTPELAAVLGAAGACGGFACVPLALKGRAQERTADMERHLSEMVEVVVLGLQSGLSFEASFGLYPRYFPTELGASMERVARRWETGLATREDALRALEAEYDSALLSRVVGSMVRSLRFGTSISESLEAAAAEAREVHRARMEERVAKVAVKMMLPVGTLILPAMLMLVLGPVLLELVQGF